MYGRGDGSLAGNESLNAATSKARALSHGFNRIYRRKREDEIGPQGDKMEDKVKSTVYSCDHCKKVLSNAQDTELEHFSINFGYDSGWAMRIHGEVEVGEYEKRWDVTNTFQGIKQFCNERCLGSWAKEYKPKKITLKSENLGKWRVTYSKK